VRLRRTALLLATLGLLAPAARAATARNFLPRALQSGAWVELFGSFEQDNNRYGPRRIEWKDTFFREKVTFFTDGYSYDPRFLQYHLQVGAALKQENYELSSMGPIEWRRGTGLEYQVRLHLLPEHAYSGELFALRYEPLFKQQSATEHSSVATSNGVDLRYRDKPWFFRGRYTDNTVDSDSSSSNVKRLGFDGEYFKRFDNGHQLSFNGSYGPSRFSNSTGVRGDTTESRLSNTVDLGRLRLYSSLARTELTQHDGGTVPTYDSDQFSWYERLTAYLPLSFRADLSYRYLDYDSTFRDAFGRSSKLSTKGDDADLVLTHRLYESLESTYTYRNSSRTSRGGDSSSFSHGLGFAYTKRIPRGHVQAGLNWGYGENESVGGTDIIEEPHSGLAVPGSFVLERSNASPGSIAIFLRSPLPPYENIQLVEGVHYSVSAFGDSYEIQVFGLPPEFVVPGSYDFFASYGLLSGSFRLRTDNFGYSLSVDLLDNLVTPYLRYARTSSDVVEGFFPGIGLDLTTTVAGVRLVRGPFRGRAEHQDVAWEQNPYTAWLGELQYVGSLTPRTSLYATASYLRRNYPQGKSRALPRALVETTQSANANLQRRFVKHSLFWSFGGGFSRTRGLFETDSYSVNSALSWKVGKLDLSAGATAYDAETRGTPAAGTRRTHYYYYFKLRRNLF